MGVIITDIEKFAMTPDEVATLDSILTIARDSGIELELDQISAEYWYICIGDFVDVLTLEDIHSAVWFTSRATN